MQITNNTTPSFGSIQVNAPMTKAQKRITERIFNTIKYSDIYNMHTDNNLDIYILAKNKNQVELRIMDPFSGFFIRNDQNRIVKEQISLNTVTERFENAIDSILDTYDKVMRGIISRPAEDVSKVMANKTEMAKYNPEKQSDFCEDINIFVEEGYALEDAFEQHKNIYPLKNPDADFTKI